MGKKKRGGEGALSKQPLTDLRESERIYRSSLCPPFLADRELSDELCVSHQKILHHFDLFVDMVEDLSAALCALLDSLLLYGVL